MPKVRPTTSGRVLCTIYTSSQKRDPFPIQTRHTTSWFWRSGREVSSRPSAESRQLGLGVGNGRIEYTLRMLTTIAREKTALADSSSDSELPEDSDPTGGAGLMVQRIPPEERGGVSVTVAWASQEEFEELYGPDPPPDDAGVT